MCSNIVWIKKKNSLSYFVQIIIYHRRPLYYNVTHNGLFYKYRVLILGGMTCWKATPHCQVIWSTALGVFHRHIQTAPQYRTTPTHRHTNTQSYFLCATYFFILHVMYIICVTGNSCSDMFLHVGPACIVPQGSMYQVPATLYMEVCIMLLIRRK